MKKAAIITGSVLAGLLVIGVIGSVVAPEPETVTKTKTVTKTVEVEVPGPTVVKTKTVTEKVTPQSCLDALDDSQAIGRMTEKVLTVVGKLPPLVPRAAQAGIDLDAGAINAITDELNAGTAELNQINPRLSGYVDSFLANAAACRAH